MRVLHVCNWASGVTTRNVNELKKYSKHSHELVTRIEHPYDMAVEPVHLTEKNSTRDMVLALADWADALHFHAVGYSGTNELPETIHGIDWSQFRGKKLFFFHGMMSSLGQDQRFYIQSPGRFCVQNLDHYDALLGPHMACKVTYGQRLHFVPDMIPVDDWLYSPGPAGKRDPVAFTFKDPWITGACRMRGLDLRLLPTPTKLTEQLFLRKMKARATFNGSVDGAWGLFALESLSQGVPTIAFIHDVNRAAWDVLEVPPPPIAECAYAGANVPEVLGALLDMPEDEWLDLCHECRVWIERFYHPHDLVVRWDKVYDEIAGVRG